MIPQLFSLLHTGVIIFLDINDFNRFLWLSRCWRPIKTEKVGRLRLPTHLTEGHPVVELGEFVLEARPRQPLHIALKQLGKLYILQGLLIRHSQI